MSEFVELVVPGVPEYLSLVRLNTGSIATRMELTLDELEDLQLAVEELCLSVLGHSGAGALAGRLHVRVEWGNDAVEVRCRLEATSARAADAPPPDAGGLPESLSRQILDALVDEHGVALDGGTTVAWLRKRRERALPAR